MGTDIHGPYIEQRNHTRDDGEAPHWGCIAEIQMSRNYELFALMAEVRRYSSFSRPSDKDLLNIMIAHSSGIVASIEEFKKLSEDEQKETVSKLDSFLDGLSDTQKQEIAKELQDTGITMGQPSFAPKGMPKDIGLSVVDKYTLFIHNSETQDEGYCTIENANSWIKSNASEVWATDDDGKITRVTGPDWHSASWLSTDEVEELIKRYEALLEAMIPDAQKQMARMQEIAKDLEKDFDKKGNWKRYNPMNSHDLKLLRGMLAMMRTMETSDRPCRIVFYFDN